MKLHIVAVLALAAAIPPVSHAAEGWLLVSKDGRQSLVYASTAGFHPIASLGHITIYDNAGPKIALLTRDNALRGGSLQIVDKRMRRVELTWPVYVFPASQLLGPSEDLLLLEEYAYFVSVRFDSTGQPIGPNSLGGYFDLTRVSLKIGDVESFPMPREITNPRLTGIGDRPIIYSSNGKYTWSFEEETHSVALIAGKYRANLAARQRDDGIPDPGDELTSGAIPGTLASLADGSRVFVDQAAVVHKIAKDGKAETLWNLATQLPGITPSLVRIIELQ